MRRRPATAPRELSRRPRRGPAAGWIASLLLGLALVLARPTSAADGPLVAALRQTVDEAAARRADPRTLDAELQRFYRARHYEPAWREAGDIERLHEALATLRDDALDPRLYAVADGQALHRAAYDDSPSTAAQLRLELRLSSAYLGALRHLAFGRLDPRTLKPRWDVAPAPLAARVMEKAADTGDPEQALAAARPPYRMYQALRRSYRDYRDRPREREEAMIPAAPVLEPGTRDPAVPILRRRLALEGFAARPAGPSEHYDDALARAVRRFQWQNGLNTDAIIGGATRTRLNATDAQRERQLRVNLERARWLLHDLPPSYVFVDIAGFSIAYYRADGEVWRSRVIVGREYRETPSLRSAIDTLVFNPAWTVPPGIFRKDIAPQARHDPKGVLERKHLRAFDGQRQELPLSRIDWDDPNSVILRQDPGPENPLGRVKLEFPNDHLVYLHDTPDPELFERDDRSDSSGCIRVEHALELARRILDAQPAPQPDVRALLGDGQTREQRLARPVPVILHYWTVSVAGDGTVLFKPDIYGRDPAVLKALEGG